MKSSWSRSVHLLFAILGVFGPLFACGLAPHHDDGDPASQREALTTGCGVTIASDTTDGDYCGYITVKNVGAVTVHQWTVDADFPSGVRVDWIDTGVGFTQTGTHVHFVPDAAHATLAASSSWEITYCNSDSATLLAQSPAARSELCTDASTDAGATTTSTATTASTATIATTATTAVLAAAQTSIGKHVLTWYSFQDNTPVNSALSASGRKLVPYVSVALPFRYLKPWGGKLAYGDQLHVDFLAGRTMPNGTKHSGWVQIDDYCGDGGDDSYCFQKVGGTTYPNVDLYIGDFTKSGMSNSTCSGPAGNGQELTGVSSGVAGIAWIGDYGARALGTGKCGDLTTAKPQQSGCWDYTPPASSKTECASCSSSSCTSW